MMSPDPLDDVDVFVEHKYSRGGDGRDDISGDVLKQYASGRITDRSVIGSVLKSKIDDLKSGETATYVIGSRNYGSDADAFVNDLKGTEIEKDALNAFLSKNNVSVITKADKASEALSNIWEAHYHDIVSSYTSEDIAEKMGDVSRMNPSQILSNANYQFISIDILSRLPDLGPKTGPVTKAADRFAKAVKVGGEALLKREIEAAGVKDYKSRSIARAFIMAVSSNTSAGWKFSAEEEDFAKYLMPFVRSLMDAEGESYRGSMNTLLTASGSGESV